MATITTQDSGARSVASVKMGNPSLVFGRCKKIGPEALEDTSKLASLGSCRSQRPCGIGTRTVRPVMSEAGTVRTATTPSSSRLNRARASLPPGIKPLLFECKPAYQDLASRRQNRAGEMSFVKIYSL